MKDQENGYGYNERLFSGGFRTRIHLARFHWVADKIREYKIANRSVLELGCFDGKLIDFLPSRPYRYVGFDANWEGGLDLAVKKWVGETNYAFMSASNPHEMQLERSDKFDVAVSMETLEHIPPSMVDGYLRKIALHLDGYALITVPNEKGIVFLAKWLVKKILSKDAEKYLLSELVNATLGRMQHVQRLEHKGFDYEVLLREVSKYFDVVEVGGFPFRLMPNSLCFGIGIVAKSKLHNINVDSDHGSSVSTE